MRELIFQVEFLSDIVLQASSNTEGKVEQLDFIPGSNFLGMVAAMNYKKFEHSFKVFHSGAVRFGDATPLFNNAPTFKMPLSFFHEKLDDKIILNHHRIEDFTKFKQLKQKRSGYITSDLKVFNLDYSYAQKSAYDKTNRRSKDSSMYGYSAIKSGVLWQFSVQIDKSISQEEVALLKSTLEGKQRLGKSKSAQYGLVNISFIKEQISSQEEVKELNEVVLYSNSRLALVDVEGNATYDLKYLCEGLEERNIAYEKTQLRTSTFTPYNRARQTKDYERVCINKGSVIVLNNITKEQLKALQNGVGAYLSEGFGELLVNPSFLNINEFSFKAKGEKKKDENLLTPTSNLAKFLQQREKEKQEKLTLAKSVSEFVVKHKNLYPQNMNSQWGSIRSFCSNNTNESIKDAVEKYISHGVAESKWKEGGKKETLLDAIAKSNTPLAFTKLLATQMPKVKNITEEQK